MQRLQALYSQVAGSPSDNSLGGMDQTVEEIRAYIGRPISELPTPSIILDKSVIENNCRVMLDNVKDKGLALRAHVKTLKTPEVTRLMLGPHKKVICSTLREIRGCLELVREGRVDEILYGIPCPPSALPQLASYVPICKIVLMIDHTSHITMLEKFNASLGSATKPWPVFIKTNVGNFRAGIRVGDPRLVELVKAAENSDAVELHGFYCHAGQSYGCESEAQLAPMLGTEIDTLLSAAALVSPENSSKPLVLSFGSTPTAHVVSSLQKKYESQIPANVTLELHGGCYPCNDLQQLVTGAIKPEDQAMRIISDVCGVYPDRNEALCNAGVIALSREQGRIEGFAVVAKRGTKTASGKGEGWCIQRTSQEHGILKLMKSMDGKVSGTVEETFAIGDRVALHVQHACIAAVAHHWFFIVDKNDIVTDVWFPWRGW